MHIEFDLLFKQAVSETLSIGAPLLLPPLRERMELLQSLLPQGPDRWDSLSKGQVREQQNLFYVWGRWELRGQKFVWEDCMYSLKQMYRSAWQSVDFFGGWLKVGGRWEVVY